jgi:tryptophan synthase alpha chain
VLETCAGISNRVPVLAMCYVNMILARGAGAFAAELAEAGAAGAIVPDLPLEEGGEIGAEFGPAGLALVPLVAPTTPPERRARICAGATGFVYLVSDVGTTGEREELPSELTELVEATRSEAPVPVAVGFGIGSPDQASAVGKIADGVIIGSRLVRCVDEAADALAAETAVTEFLRETRSALSPGRS